MQQSVRTLVFIHHLTVHNSAGVEIIGAERKSRIPDEETNWNTAYHESGHALVAYYTKDSDPVHKVRRDYIRILLYLILTQMLPSLR